MSVDSVTFRIGETNEERIPRELIYTFTDHAFDTTPRPSGSTLAVSVNELELMVHEQSAEIVGVTGYCPLVNDAPEPLLPPPSRQARLILSSERPLIPGVVRALSPGRRWPVSIDRRSGWVRVGVAGCGGHGETVAFLTGAVATIVADRLTTLYLHPRMVHPV